MGSCVHSSMALLHGRCLPAAHQQHRVWGSCPVSRLRSWTACDGQHTSLMQKSSVHASATSTHTEAQAGPKPDTQAHDLSAIPTHFAFHASKSSDDIVELWGEWNQWSRGIPLHRASSTQPLRAVVPMPPGAVQVLWGRCAGSSLLRWPALCPPACLQHTCLVVVGISYGLVWVRAAACLKLSPKLSPMPPRCSTNSRSTSSG